MHSVNFYSFRVLTHKGSRASKKLNELGLSNKKTAYELFVDYFTLYKNTPIEFGVSKTKISLEQHAKEGANKRGNSSRLTQSFH
ncbi:hypothetical protein, partial [Escherichia coli]|uniref:hypothetical protein n=1 Tax=Escherichia coli TaxID=562 RepID=UPI000B7D2D37